MSDHDDEKKKQPMEAFLAELLAAGQHACTNVIRGCRARLDASYTKKRCPACLENDRIKDNARRAKKQEEANEMAATTSDRAVCIGCGEAKPKDAFIGERSTQPTKRCRECRNKGKEIDARRDRDRRNELARIAERKEERVAKKREWKEANPEKVEQAMKVHRAQARSVDPEGFRRRQAENQRQWRQTHPNQVADFNDRRANTVDGHYGATLNAARQKGVACTLTRDAFGDLVTTPCFYCGQLDARGFNGVNRNDCTGDYSEENCMSCCNRCMTAKGCLDGHHFIRRARHLANHDDGMPGGDDAAFGDRRGSSYQESLESAARRDIEFIMPRPAYQGLTDGACYLCGKTNSSTHRNGLDRIDSNIGYRPNNCRPCCAECNLMKSNASLESFREQMKRIRAHREGIPLPSPTGHGASVISKNGRKPNSTQLQRARQERLSATEQRDREYLASVGKATRSVSSSAAGTVNAQSVPSLAAEQDEESSSSEDDDDAKL
jgi:hypothetical protein